MPDLLDWLRSGRVLLMDGAMGTQLQALGARPDECLELWNLTHPERVRGVHQAYADAGARCLLTHTFQAHACAAAGPERYVLGDIGPQPELAEVPALLDAFGELVDGFLLETFYDRQA